MIKEITKTDNRDDSLSPAFVSRTVIYGLVQFYVIKYQNKPWLFGHTVAVSSSIKP